MPECGRRIAGHASEGGKGGREGRREGVRGETQGLELTPY